MRKYSSFLLATLFLTGCPNFALRSTGKAVIVLRPTYGAGSLATKAELPVYSKETINHLVLKLFTVNGEVETPVLSGSGEIARDILKSDLDSSIVLGNLKTNTTYRIRGYAYKAAGTNPVDLISDASSYTDVAVLTDDRPTMSSIPVKLVDRNFAGQGTGSIAVTPGGYSYDYSEGFASYYNTTYRITTVAGGIPPENIPATTAMMVCPAAVACDGSGNFYIADTHNYRIRKVSADGKITTIAGNGTRSYSGDGGPATLASISYPYGVAVDAAGNVYISDNENYRIRKVSTNGIITTVAGNGISGYSGDGGPATDAQIKDPKFINLDGAGNLYIGDVYNARIRKVTPDGKISTFAGNGVQSFAGDSGQANQASLNYPFGAAADVAGNIYIADNENYRIRKVAPDGTISTIAGNGTNGFSGDGGPATAAQIYVVGIVVTGDGSVLFSGGNRIRKVSPDGIISTIAGNGTITYNGEGLPALEAQINPEGLELDTAGNLLFADNSANRIRKLANGIITTVAGNGIQGYGGGYSGDGGLAVSAWLKSPSSVLARTNGEILIADSGNARIRKIGTDGRISTVAGTGTVGFSGDGGQATLAQISASSVREDAAGNVYFAGGNRIRKVSTDGTITTVAGNGLSGYVADGGPATETKIRAASIAVNEPGEIFIAEGISMRVRKVGLDGKITTIAGNGVSGYSGDGGPATSAMLKTPNGVLVDTSGNFYIADSGNSVIRKVDKDGIITTIAGNGTGGYSGDGGPATAAQLKSPSRMALDKVGNFYILDAGNNCIRKITPAGNISTIVGPWTTGYSGDNGIANSAQLNAPTDLTVDRLGHVYVVDCGNHAIRRLD